MIAIYTDIWMLMCSAWVPLFHREARLSGRFI